MSKKITKISRENFSAAADYAYALNKIMTANIHAQNIVLPLGSILFAIHILILLLGITYEIVTENNVSLAIFDTLRFIPDYCHYLWKQFGYIAENAYVKVAMSFALVYLVPLIVCGVIRLILPLFVKGHAPKLTGTDAAVAKQLYLYVDQGPFHKQDSHDAQLLWCRISGIGIIACFTVIISHALFANLQMANFNYWFILLAVIIVLAAVLIYNLYAKLYYLFTLTIKHYYTKAKIRDDFLAEVKSYWLSIDPKERKRIQEEEAAKKDSYDGWKYKKLEETLYYKSKFNEHYAKYMGLPYETDEDEAKRIVREVEEDLSGKSYGDY